MKLLNNSDGFLIDYIKKMHVASSFKQCFTILTQSIEMIGFDGVIYSYVPFSFTQKPIIYQSASYGDDYLQTYQDNNLFASDHVVQAAINGKKTWLNWFDENTLETLDSNALSVIDTTKKFGINNGLSFRTFLSSHAYAGVSVIYRKDGAYFQEICLRNIEVIQMLVDIFHQKVTSKHYHQPIFLKPLLSTLTPTKLSILHGLSCGHNLKKIASDLGRSEKYISNLSSNLSKDMGLRNKEQLLYIAGVFQFNEFHINNN